jgi:hypothetical protein
MKEKIYEHVIFFILTLLLTYLTAQIPILRDTHRFVKSDIEINRTHYRINNSQEVTYSIINKGNLSLDDSNTFIEYKSNQTPTSVILFDENGNSELIKISNQLPELFRLSYPNWLKSRESVMLRITYKTNQEISDETIIKFSRDGKFSTITSNSKELSSSSIKSEVNVLIWMLFLLIFIMILISVYWVKSTYPKIKEWYFNELTKRFIANKNQFLTDDDKN